MNFGMNESARCAVEKERRMSIDELFEIVASGKVTAPVGTRTLALMSVDAEGNFQMAGQTNKNDALRIAYLMMKQVFEPKERGKDADTV